MTVCSLKRSLISKGLRQPAFQVTLRRRRLKRSLISKGLRLHSIYRPRTRSCLKRSLISKGLRQSGFLQVFSQGV